MGGTLYSVPRAGKIKFKKEPPEMAVFLFTKNRRKAPDFTHGECQLLQIIEPERKELNKE